MPTHTFDLVVAHSLGGAFAFSLLTRGLLSCRTLVAIGSSPGPKDHPGMNTFLKYPIDFPLVRKRAERIIVVQSFDDPWTHPEYGIILLKHTNGTGLFYADKGHFDSADLPQDLLCIVDTAMSGELPKND